MTTERRERAPQGKSGPAGWLAIFSVAFAGRPSGLSASPTLLLELTCSIPTCSGVALYLLRVVSLSREPAAAFAMGFAATYVSIASGAPQHYTAQWNERCPVELGGPKLQSVFIRRVIRWV